MKTRSSRRPLVAVALATAVVLAFGTLAGAATSGQAARHGRRQAAHGAVPAAPAALSTVQHWVSRLLAAAGLAPAPPTPPATTTHDPSTQTVLNDNGAGIDPNG
jgi:hypothetical protein